jgi:hypothetical protein
MRKVRYDQAQFGRLQKREAPMQRWVRPLTALAALALVLAAIAIASADAPANQYFERTWARTDKPVQDGQAVRT